MHGQTKLTFQGIIFTVSNDKNTKVAYFKCSKKHLKLHKSSVQSSESKSCQYAPSQKHWMEDGNLDKKGKSATVVL